MLFSTKTPLINTDRQVEISQGGKADFAANSQYKAFDSPYILDRVEVTQRGLLQISGWAHSPRRSKLRCSEIVLIDQQGRLISFESRPLFRQDVGAVFKSRRAHHSGFYAIIDTRDIPAGTYKISLAMKQDRKHAPRTRVLKSVIELDDELEYLKQIQGDFATWAAARHGFSYQEDLNSLPSDPYSPAYLQAQLKLYEGISGTTGYNPWLSEPISIAVQDAIDPYPFPFSTRHAEHIGNHLLSLGHIFRAIGKHAPGARSILEYGCGTGFTTIFLAASGFDMTAVDINADALKVVDGLAEARRLKINTHVGEFGSVPDENKRDVVLFYEAFHHCLDFPSMLKRLHELTSDGGCVIFAGEPIFPDFPKPWGLRIDGPSLWEIRTKGWLELGFNEHFFIEALKKFGWSVVKETYELSPPIFIARKA